MKETIKFHHIGVACKDIEQTAEAYRLLGYEKGNVLFDPLQNVNICFLSHKSMPVIELLSPVDETSPVVKILSKNGTTPYHICYIVDDMVEALKYFKRYRFVIVSKPKEACAIENKHVAFLYNSEVGLIELVES